MMQEEVCLYQKLNMTLTACICYIACGLLYFVTVHSLQLSVHG